MLMNTGRENTLNVHCLTHFAIYTMQVGIQEVESLYIYAGISHMWDSSWLHQGRVHASLVAEINNGIVVIFQAIEMLSKPFNAWICLPVRSTICIKELCELIIVL